MNFEPGPDGVVRISFEIADLKTWVQIPVGALKFLLNALLGADILFNSALSAVLFLEKKMVMVMKVHCVLSKFNLFITKRNFRKLKWIEFKY